jgi:acetyl esterase/lipase
VRGRAREWNADPERVALIGRRPVRNWPCWWPTGTTTTRVRGVVSIYGPADLRYAWEHPGNPRVYDGIGTIERHLGGRPADVGQVYDDASPYQFVGPNTPATLLVHGGRDEIVSVVQSQRLAERLRAHGRPHVLVAPGWATHGCDYHFAGPCGQLSTFAIERFLAAVL